MFETKVLGGIFVVIIFVGVIRPIWAIWASRRRMTRYERLVEMSKIGPPLW